MAVPTSSATCRTHSPSQSSPRCSASPRNARSSSSVGPTQRSPRSASPPIPVASSVAAEEMFEFFVEVIEDRAKHPKDDLVSMLVTRGSDGEEPLTVDEIVGFCILLLIAGNETTTNLLGNWMRMLVDRPDVEAALRADPPKIAASFEEQLRYDGPVQCLFRGTTAPTEVGGQALDAGTRLLVLFAAANRDEEKWGPDAGDLPARSQPHRPRRLRARHPPVPRRATRSPRGPRHGGGAVRAARRHSS